MFECSNLSSFGSKFIVLKKVLVTLLGLFGAPIVIWRLGIVLPCSRRCVSDCDHMPVEKKNCIAGIIGRVISRERNSPDLS